MKKAFTIIELLVVVLIIGILAAIALPQYQKAVTRSRFANLMPLTRAIQEAEERYYLANNTYTASFDDLDIDYGDKRGNYYYYHGGYCSLTWWDKAVACGLQDETPTVFYIRTFIHSNKNGKAYCVIDKESPWQHICQNISGKNEPVEQGDYYAYEMD